jgi:hypothetical protein
MVVSHYRQKREKEKRFLYGENIRRCTSFNRRIYRYILRRFSGPMLEGEVRGSKHRWFKNGKCEMKKKKRVRKKKKVKRQREIRD